MRLCGCCGGSLEGRRAVAVYCGPACRREAFRIARLSRGEPDGHYVTLSQYANRQRRRANRSGEA